MAGLARFGWRAEFQTRIYGETEKNIFFLLSLHILVHQSITDIYICV